MLIKTKYCDICQEKNKKIFKLDGFKYGDNAPPLHPHCRCTIAPYEDTTEFDAWLDHVGSGGETTWDNWKKLVKRDILKRNTLKIDIQHFAKRSEDFETVILPKQEYAHVMSEIATNLTEEQANKKVFSKTIGDYIYTVENNGFGDYRVIKKIKIEEDL